ncbi:MAG: transglutaminase domain-containing protein [Acidimicrobiia bacterium]|nr:transglutaminase domain-containing protein [Acidimicrobiia bacterium]
MRGRLVELALVTVLSALAGWGFTVAFVFADLAPVVFAAAVTAGLVAAVNTVVRTGVAVSLATQGLALAGGLVVLVRDVEGGVVGSLVGVLADGPARISTVAVPAPGEPELLVVPFVGVWVACAVGCELARRTTASLAPALPPVVVLVASQVFVLPSTPRSSGPLWAVVAVAAGLAAVRHRRTEQAVPTEQVSPAAQAAPAEGDDIVGSSALRSSTGAQVAAVRRRSSAVVVAAIAVLAVVAVAAAALPVVTAREPMTLREHFAEPPRSPVVDNPLGSIVANYLDDPQVDEDVRRREVLTIEFDEEVPLSSGFDGDDRLRIGWVVLDSFDGSNWRTSATFDPVARELPPPLASPSQARRAVSGTATLHEVDGPWLPMVGRAEEVTFLEGGRSLLVDLITGSVAVPGATVTTESAGPVRYRFAAVPPPTAPLEELGPVAGLPEDGADWRRLLDAEEDLPGLVQRLEQLRDELFLAESPGSIGFVGQLRRVEALFHSRLAEQIVESGIDVDDLPRLAEQPFTFLLPPEGLAQLPVQDSPDVAVPSGRAELRVPTGHSFEALLQFLGSSPPGSEGEVPPNAGEGTPEQFAAAGALLLRSAGIPTRVVVGWSVPGGEIDDGIAVVRRDHADAWVEVWSANHGWVALDTTPLPDVEPTPLDLADLEPPPPADPLADEETELVALDDDTAQDTGAGGILDSEAWWFPLAVLVLAVVLLGIVAPMAILAVRRDRRRRTVPAAAAVAAAWDDAIEELMASGLSVAVTMTPTEVVEQARHHLGEAPLEQLATLATLVDQSAHDHDEPTTEMARAAWRSADRVRRVIRNHASPTTRLVRGVDVRPALRRRRQLQRAERLRAATTREARPAEPTGSLRRR